MVSGKKNKKIVLSTISWITSALLLAVVILVVSGFQVPLFFGAFLISLLRILIAYAIAVLLGMAIAFLFWKIQFLKKFFVPILEGMQSFPALLLLPLAAMWFGFNNFAIIFFLVFLIIWPIIFSAYSSLESTPRDWQEAAKVFGATGIKKMFYLIFTYNVSRDNHWLCYWMGERLECHCRRRNFNCRGYYYQTWYWRGAMGVGKIGQTDLGAFVWHRGIFNHYNNI